MNKEDVRRIHSQRNLKVAYATVAATKDKNLKSKRDTVKVASKTGGPG